ncbi:class I SAM-dependent methyltransferase [Nonomuraea typhae]|uniref:class I SAM-dependent methyltransferase n=1 Tax=Nonomuraea typhae TaxID=2603600 RepID=UPI001FEB2C8E|nr:class I SAM-dependent methyltransferase [Nonomuraea typhae]
MRRGTYGFDAPWPFAGLIAGAAVLLSLTVVSFAFDVAPAGVAFLLGGLYTLASALSYAYTTRRGKFAVWERELDDLDGGERVLDLGCGRGAVLMTAAKRLSKKGRAAGLDLWQAKDQTGNRAAAARANAGAEGVADRVDLVTGDMRALPFAAGAFDVVVSSLALHDIAAAEGRAEGVREAYRVLAPGGRLLIADFQRTEEYEAVLRDLGAANVRRRNLGWRFWYGGPWFATWMVEAAKRSE